MPTRKQIRERRLSPTAAAEVAALPMPTRLALPHYLLLVLIALAGLLSYANCTKGVFVFDDDKWVTKGRFYDRRPVVGWSLLINNRLAGPGAVAGEPDPRGYHQFNLAVHVLAGLALFGVVRRTLLTERLRERFAGVAPWFAFAVALLWIVHPLQTQSVMYVIQRGQSMMGLFYLLTLYCVLRGAASPRFVWPWYGAAVVACALGMGSKEDMVTAPLLVVLFDLAFLSGTIEERVRRRWPLYAGLFATLAILGAVGAGNVLKTDHKGPATVGFSFKGVTPVQYLMTQAEVIPHYLRLSLWPDKLCLDYGWPYVTSFVTVWWKFLGMLLLLGASVFGLIRRHPLGFVGAAFFVILAPTSSVVPIRDLAVEHRMYLPLAAVVIVAVSGLYALLRRVLSGPALAVGLMASAALPAIPLGMRTFERNGDYTNEFTIWRTAIAVAPGNSRAYYNLGKELGEEADRLKAAGKKEEGEKLAGEAMAQYREALSREPNHVTANNNLGMELAKAGRRAEAEPYFRKVIELDRRHNLARNNLGLLLSDMGRHEEALPWYEQSIAIRKKNPEVYFNYGVTLQRMGRFEEAAEKYRKALELRPGHTRAAQNLANVNKALGR